MKEKKSDLINEREKCYSLTYKSIEDRIIVVRGKSVMLDTDVALLYGVETRRINEAVKNNKDKFPADYVFALTDSELQSLRSKCSTANVSVKSRVTPKAFTEKGLYMIATILKSPKARDVTFAIIETFAKVRRLKRELIEIHREQDEVKRKQKMHSFGRELSDIVMPDMETSETESTLELNFFIGDGAFGDALSINMLQPTIAEASTIAELDYTTSR